VTPRHQHCSPLPPPPDSGPATVLVARICRFGLRHSPASLFLATVRSGHPVRWRPQTRPMCRFLSPRPCARLAGLVRQRSKSWTHWGNTDAARSGRSGSSGRADRQDRLAPCFRRELPQTLVVGQIVLDRCFVEIDTVEPAGLRNVTFEAVYQRQGLPLLR
jgi:hypothetical protein